MAFSKQLHNYLEQASNQHFALSEKFKEFASFVKGCMQTPGVANHNISVSLQTLDQGYFSTTYANRTVTFVFNSFRQESGNLAGTVSGNLAGNVKCYVHKQFPESKQVEIGEFEFNEDGNTNLNLPGEDAKINIANDFGTLHIALHFIRLSLVK